MMDTALCSTCTSIKESDFLAIGKDSQLPKHVANLKTFDQLQVQPCQGCQLFSSVAELVPNNAAPPNLSLWIHKIRPSIISGRQGLVLVVASTGSRRNLDRVVETRGAISIVTEDSSADTSAFVPARRVCPDGVDFRSFRERVGFCELIHGLCNAVKTGLPWPKDLRLIDCKTLRLVQNVFCQYTALSYVWGRDTRRSSRDNKLPEDKLLTNLPRTIRDAIAATLDLGYNHIWIDRYCIDQSDEEDILRQIDQMNLIYRHAEVTLFAIAGTDPHFGLPGTTKTRRQRQPGFSIGKTVLVSIFNHPDFNVMSQSVWSTRGWTYQEAYFSRRRLFFLENQTYFECYRAGAAESIHPSSKRTHQAMSKKRENHDRSLHKVFDHLKNYSGRRLTHDKDALRAVAGMFNDFRHEGEPTPHFTGIPIITSGISLWNEARQKTYVPAERSVTDAFLAGLSWRSLGTGRRRNVWPTRSWTWAEWDVGLTYGSCNKDDFSHTLKSEDLPQVRLEKNDRTFVDLGDKQALSMVKDGQQLSGFIHIYSWIIPLNMRPAILRRLSSLSANSIMSELEVPKEKQRDGKIIPNYNIEPKNRNFNVNLDFWPLDPSFSNDRSRLEEPDGILGIVLSRKYKAQRNWSYILMVVQERGGHFERVGICKLTRKSMFQLAKLEGLTERSGMSDVEEQDWDSKLCSKYMEQRWLRIG